MSARRALSGLGLCAGLLAPAAAHAQATVVIDIDDYQAQQLGIDADQLEADLNAAIEQDLKLEDQSAFLSQMARAALMAGKGMGVDYASNPQRFVLGGSVGSAVNAAGARFGRGDDGLPKGGFAFQAAAMAGLNLGAFTDNDKSALRRFVVYVNGMSANTQLDPFKASFYNVGAHLQIKVIGAAGEGKTAEWGGLDLTSGYEIGGYKLHLEQPIPIEADPVTWDAEGNLSIGTDSASVPVELSTNLRILVATVYLGGAYDYNTNGYAKTEAGLIGPILANVGEESEQSVGRAEVTIVQSGADVQSYGRLFAGAQVELFLVKVYGHLNVGFDDSFGGHLGLRLAI